MSVDVEWFPDYGHIMAGIFWILYIKMAVSLENKNTSSSSYFRLLGLGTNQSRLTFDSK